MSALIELKRYLRVSHIGRMACLFWGIAFAQLTPVTAQSIKLPSACAGAATNFTDPNQEPDLEACLDRLPLMAADDQEAVLTDYLRNGRTYIPQDRMLEISNRLVNAQARRLRAAELVERAQKKSPDITMDVERAISDAEAVGDTLVLAHLYRAKVDIARLQRNNEALIEALETAENLAEADQIRGLIPHFEFRRGDMSSIQAEYAQASAHYKMALDGYLVSKDMRSAGMTCGRLGYTVGRDKSITADSLDEMVIRAKTEGSPYLACYLSAQMKHASQKHDNYELVAMHGEASVAAARRSGYASMVPDILNTQAISAKRAGRYVDAIDAYERASQAYKDVGIDFMVAAINVNIGRIFLELGSVDQAITVTHRALREVEEAAPDRLDFILKIQFQLGDAYAKAGQYEDARDWFKKARATSDTQPVRYFDGMIDAQYARALYEIGDTDDALKRAKGAADIMLTNGDHPDEPEAAAMLVWMGTKHLERGEIKAAEQALNQAKGIMEPDGQGADSLIDGVGNLYTRLEYARGTAKLKTAMGLEEAAAPYTRVALALSETRFETEKLRAVANAELKWELQTREQQMALLRQDAELTNLTLRQSETRNYIWLAMTLISAVIAFLIWRSYRSQKQLALTQQQLAASKDTYLTEIHHRMSNNMQLISSLLNMDARQGGQKSAEVASRARTMALIHNHIFHHGQSGAVDAYPFLNELVKLLDEALGNDTVTLQTDIEPALLDLGVVTPCGLFICEAVTNAFKHAFDDQAIGEITIRLKKEATTLVLQIEDTGKGCDNPVREGSYGMGLLEDLASQMNADFSFESSAGGTVVSIEGIAHPLA